jgi:hypothetical protein
MRNKPSTHTCAFGEHFISKPKQSLKESLSKQILLIMDLSVDDRGGAGRE